MSPRDPQPGKKTPPEEAASAKTSEPERSGRPGRSSAPNALGVDPGSPFAPEKERPPVARARDLEDAGEDYEPAAPELIEWTPERAGNIIKAIGWALHQADGLSDPIDGDELGAELWKATEDDAIAIGTPLARILNRYQPARRLAGVSDEAELAFAFAGYARRNLALRGRIAATREKAEAAGPKLVPSQPEEKVEGWPGSGAGGLGFLPGPPEDEAA